MYPGTKFNWIDLTTLTIQEPESVDDSPLFLQAFACDKGPEELTVVKGNDFAKLYGTQSFSKYGQAGIQAQNIINAGGRLLAKRVVASDSTLAYTIVTVTVTYANGKVNLNWNTVPVVDAETIDEFDSFAAIVEYAKTLEVREGNECVYPVMVITDNGRGVSQKSFRISPDYSTSKTIGHAFYTISALEGTSITEKQPMTFDTDVIYNNVAYRLDRTSMVQLDTLTIESVYDHFINKVAELAEKTLDDVRNTDLIFGYDLKGNPLDWVENVSEVNLNADTGVLLQGGSDGSFIDSDPDKKPKDTDEFVKVLTAFFEGTDVPETATRWIYDLDEYKIAAVVDANYPFKVKRAIAELANMREDFVYFRDYGLGEDGEGLRTYLEIESIHDGTTPEYMKCITDTSSWFVMDYVTSYMINDPVEKKQIRVTMTYDLAADLVNHIARSANAPVAGIANGFILSNAIKGTISFTPQIQRVKNGTEEGYNTFVIDNQKQAMDDLHVNYAIFQENDCVVQGTYTAHQKATQMIYGNNILAIQEVMRAVRTACPRIRYSLSTGEDLENYQKDVNAVLEKFQSNFSILNFKYEDDPLMRKQKIFKASIEFAFMDWVQSEIFDIYAIDNY